MARKKIKISIILIILLTALSVVYFSFIKKKGPEYSIEKVKRGLLTQTVSETGVVKAASEIDLSFLNTGKILSTAVKVGDIVKKDQILAELDYGNLLIKEKEAKANLDKLLKGASEEEIAVSQANVNKAENDYLSALAEYDKAEKTVEENISQAEKTLSDLESETENDVTTYEKAVDVAQTNLSNTKSTYKNLISNEENDLLSTVESEIVDADAALDSINTVLNDNDASSVLSIRNTGYLSDTKSSYNSAILLYGTANNSLTAAKLNKTEISLNQAVADVKSLLDKTFESLNNCFNALEASVTTSSFTQTDLDAYKTAINTKLTTISSSISSVNTAKQDLDKANLNYNTNVSSSEKSLEKAMVDLDNAKISAKNSLNTAKISGDQQLTAAQAKITSAKQAYEVAKAQLAQIKAPARQEDIILNQAALDSVRDQINNSIIKAPIDGTITKINYETGEQSVAGKAAVSMLGVNNFEIEVDISETDIAKINKGNSVEITLDAFGDDIKFAGTVYFIEPAETVIQEVIYYKVKINFINNEILTSHQPNIKSGMTVNTIITTNRKNNVISIPSRAIIEKNGSGKFARLLVNGEVKEVPVETGMRGDNGIVEIKSGVKEGDLVITFIKENK